MAMFGWCRALRIGGIGCDGWDCFRLRADRQSQLATDSSRPLAVSRPLAEMATQYLNAEARTSVSFGQFLERVAHQTICLSAWKTFDVFLTDTSTKTSTDSLTSEKRKSTHVTTSV